MTRGQAANFVFGAVVIACGVNAIFGYMLRSELATAHQLEGQILEFNKQWIRSVEQVNQAVNEVNRRLQLVETDMKEETETTIAILHELHQARQLSVSELWEIIGTALRERRFSEPSP